MAGRPPRTAKWSALENKQGKTGPVRLLVDGEIEVANTGLKPVLKEAPRGPNPKTLNLQLTIPASSGAGNFVQIQTAAGDTKKVAVGGWARASYVQKTKSGQYDSVGILWDGKPIATCKVVDDNEYYQHLAALTNAVNTAHPVRKSAKRPSAGSKKPARAPGRKSAAKKPAGKKAPAKKRAESKAAPAKRRTTGKRAPNKRAGTAKKRSASRKKR